MLRYPGVMGMPKIRKGQWALVTGGSSGIGSCFALQLAERGMNLTLVGRDKSDLQNVAQTIRYKNGVVVETESVDFVKEPERIKEFAERRTYDLLCNNAGMGAYGRYLDVNWERHRDTVLLNVLTLTELSFLVGRRMAERRSGGIINVGSLAGFFPLANFAIYSATKAYVYHFSLALWAEFRLRGVHVLCVTPGPTESKFFERSRPQGVQRTKGKRILMRAEDVVRQTLQAYEKDKIICIPGWKNRFLTFMVRRFFPDWIIAKFSEKFW